MHAGPASWNELPQTGVAIVREGYVLEFKRQIDPNGRAELAKDVALLANMYGGIILVGADETAAGVEYPGLPLAIGRAVAEAYALAVRDFCSPRPIFVLSEIPDPMRPHTMVVCVTVEPFPDQLVGTAAADGQGRPTDAWRFPIRVNRHAVLLRPEQLMVWFNPQTRRAAIGLSEIPEGTIVQVACVAGTRANSQFTQFEAKLVGWRVSENYVELAPAETRIESFRAPLEDVAAVWSSKPNERSLRLRGSIVAAGGRFRYHAGG